MPVFHGIIVYLAIRDFHNIIERITHRRPHHQILHPAVTNRGQQCYGPAQTMTDQGDPGRIDIANSLPIIQYRAGLVDH
ncbi:hypothetical protein D3C85_1475150 [compost metagenome]